MLNSHFTQLCPVSLPYQGRQMYMHGFDLANPTMPKGLEDYLEPVVALCKAAGAFVGKAYMTVDEKLVKAGATQRKPKPHVDGCFHPEIMDWGHGGGGWNHVCNGVPVPRMPVIVASSFAACKAWQGKFDAKPKSDGDLSHIEQELGEGTLLAPNVGYLLSPDCIHESLPMKVDTHRTFLRIALPVLN